MTNSSASEGFHSQSQQPNSLQAIKEKCEPHRRFFSGNSAYKDFKICPQILGVMAEITGFRFRGCGSSMCNLKTIHGMYTYHLTSGLLQFKYLMKGRLVKLPPPLSLVWLLWGEGETGHLHKTKHYQKTEVIGWYCPRPEGLEEWHVGYLVKQPQTFS